MFQVTFENICKMFASLDPGPLPDDLNKYTRGVVAGLRAQPFNFPGTAFHKVLQVNWRASYINLLNKVFEPTFLLYESSTRPTHLVQVDANGPATGINAKKIFYDSVERSLRWNLEEYWRSKGKKIILRTGK